MTTEDFIFQISVIHLVSSAFRAFVLFLTYAHIFKIKVIKTDIVQISH